MNCACIIKVKGTVAKVSGREIGIYVSRKYQQRLAPLLGKRVTVLVIHEGD